MPPQYLNGRCSRGNVSSNSKASALRSEAHLTLRSRGRATWTFAIATRGPAPLIHVEGLLFPSPTDCLWPIPGLPGPLRNLTMAGRARASKVSLLARRRTHAPGQERTLTNVCLAAQLHRVELTWRFRTRLGCRNRRFRRHGAAA